MGETCNGFYWDNFDSENFTVVHQILDGWVTFAKYKEEDGLCINVADEWGNVSREDAIAAARAILKHFNETDA